MIKQNASIQQAVLSQVSAHLSSNGTTHDSLPKDWKMVRLGDVFKFTKKPKDLRYSMFEHIPFVPMDLIPIGCVSFDQFISKTNDELSSGTYFEVGDLLIAKITPSFENGKQGIIDSLPTPFGIATTEVIPINEVEGISDKYYLFYYLLRQDIRSELAGKMEGSTGRQRLSITSLANLVLPFPPLSQQREIAKLLRIVQETIQTRRDELKLEHEYKATLKEYLFTHGIREELRKKTEIGEIPESWQVVELGEIITLHRGYDLPMRDRRPGIVPIISSSGISGAHSETKVTGPGVVTGRYGTIGEVFYVEQDFWPLNTTLYVSEFRNVTPHFVAYLLQTLNFAAFNDKSSVPGVNRNDLHRIKTILPDLSDQQDIVDVLSTYDTKISALEQETTLLEELFRALLEELMTGRLLTFPLIEEGDTHD